MSLGGDDSPAAQLAMLDALKYCPCGACGPLIGRAAAKQEELCVDEAAALYRRAATERPTCCAALNGLADCMMSMGDKDTAVDALRKSIALAPDGLAERYMNLGQLTEGAEALQWLEGGVKILRNEWQVATEAAGGKKGNGGKKARSAAAAEARGGSSSGGGGSSSVPATTQALEATHALASALCSVAEVYLTDACDEPDAEAKCEAAAGEALALIAPLPAESRIAEPFVTAASLRLSQERGEEACALLADALAILRAADESSPPSYDLRLSAAKLLMEVGQPNEAAEVLQGLRLEHDDQLEAWYLLACAAMQAGDAGLALEEARSALAFAASDACPPEEREWMAQLEELVQEAAEAAGEEA